MMLPAATTPVLSRVMIPQSAAVYDAEIEHRVLKKKNGEGEVQVVEDSDTDAADRNKNPCRVYVGNINFAMTEAEISNIFASFGPVKSCNLVINTDNNSPAGAAAAAAAAAGVVPHRGYGFVEYYCPESANAAVASMHNFQIGGRLLRVNHASPLNDPVKSAVAAANHAQAAAAAAAAATTAMTMTTQDRHCGLFDLMRPVFPQEDVRGIIEARTSALKALAESMMMRK